MIVLVGCNNPMKKSITEELTIEEIKTISKKDPGFLAFYDRYFENKCYEGFLKDKTIQVLYSDLTYKRFYEYVLQINDDGFVNSVYDEAEKSWHAQYGYTEHKFDSIISYWQQYVADNSPETYLDIEFDHAAPYKDYYDKGVRLYFKLIPQREKLLSVWFDYTIKLKDEKHKNVICIINQTAHHIYSFSEPIVINDYVRVYSKNSFYDDVAENKLSSEDLREKYEFEYKINNIETDKDGYINEYSSYKEVPFEVGLFLKDSSLKNKELVIKRYIDGGYVTLDEYKNSLQNQRMEEKDSMCYNFLKFIVDCKSALR
jgi:hypothetical protein